VCARGGGGPRLPLTCCKGVENVLSPFIRLGGPALPPSAFTTSAFAVCDRLQMAVWNTRADLVRASHMANGKGAFKRSLRARGSRCEQSQHPGICSVGSMSWQKLSLYNFLSVMWAGSRCAQSGQHPTLLVSPRRPSWCCIGDVGDTPHPSEKRESQVAKGASDVVWF